jgi:hypothetical protein
MDTFKKDSLTYNRVILQLSEDNRFRQAQFWLLPLLLIQFARDPRTDQEAW